MSEHVIYEQDGAVVTLTLNRPERRNAVSDEMIEGIVAACARINADMSVGCVILTGAGDGFCSGGDMEDMRARRGHFSGTPVETRRIYRHGIQRIPAALFHIEVPTIAAVNGAAVGAGCDMTLMCDMRLASEKATFAESFMRVGLVSGDGGAWFLPRVVGMQLASYLTFTGEFIDARRALEIGLVLRVLPPGELMVEARRLAERIAAQPPHALRLNKRLLRSAPHQTLEDSLELGALMQAAAQQTDDHREAYTAFLEKRRPRFSGR